MSNKLFCNTLSTVINFFYVFYIGYIYVGVLDTFPQTLLSVFLNLSLDINTALKSDRPRPQGRILELCPVV